MIQCSISKRYEFSQHIRFCNCDSGVVLLDLKSARYLGISRSDALNVATFVPSLREKFGRETIEPELVAPGKILEELLSLNYITDVNSPDPPREAQLPTLTESAFNLATKSRPQIGSRHLLQYTQSFVTTVALLRFSTLEGIYKRYKRARQFFPSRSSSSPDIVRDMVNIHFHLSPFFYSAKNRCLFDSLVLYNFLLCNSIPGTWVVGVKTRPFSAHSWVQYEHIVLNDTSDHCRIFNPILAV